MDVLRALRAGDLARIDAAFAPALDEKACSPDLETEAPESKTALLRAVERQDHARVERYIGEWGCSVDHENSQGDTALSEAVKTGCRPMIRRLVALGARLDRANVYGETALTHMMRCGSVEGNDGEGHLADAVQWLLDQPGAPMPGPTDLVEAVVQGRHQVMCVLLNHDDNRRRALDAADEVPAMPSILNAVDPTCGRTPVMAAASAGHSGTCVLLLQRGADVNAESPAGHTALSMAAFHGHDDTVRALLAQGGADVNLETTKGFTALLQCCLGGHSNTVRILADAGADVNAQNIYGETPLTTAARCGRADCVIALLTRGAKVNYETRTGRTALHEAARNNRAEVVSTLLLEPDLLLNHVSHATGRTPLMTAVAGGATNAVKVLVSQRAVRPTDPKKIGLDMHMETSSGDTALTVAVACGQADAALQVMQAMVELVREDSHQKPNGAATAAVKVTNEAGELKDAEALKREQAAAAEVQRKQQRQTFQQAVLAARMLLSTLQRVSRKAKDNAESLVRRQEPAEICQAAQTVLEATQEGVKMAAKLMRELAEQGAADGGSGVSAIDAARWSQEGGV